jgi:hypothetical protein
MKSEQSVSCWQDSHSFAFMLHLDPYLATAEVILEQNVYPGWIQKHLVPILKQCGMRGGVCYNISVQNNTY